MRNEEDAPDQRDSAGGEGGLYEMSSLASGGGYNILPAVENSGSSLQTATPIYSVLYNSQDVESGGERISHFARGGGAWAPQSKADIARETGLVTEAIDDAGAPLIADESGRNDIHQRVLSRIDSAGGVHHSLPRGVALGVGINPTDVPGRQPLAGELATLRSGTGPIRISIAVVFRVFFSLWLLVLTVLVLRSGHSSPSPGSNQPLSLSSVIHIANLPNGKKALKMDVEKIIFSAAANYEVTEKVVKGSRVWSDKVFAIYAGDTISWSWSTNENVVSCDHDGVIYPVGDKKRVIDSGPLAGGNNKFSFTFYEAGTYYYTSANSQTMVGIIMVFDAPGFSLDRSGMGAIALIPTGVQKNFDFSDYPLLEGCWEPCYDQPYGTITPDSFLSSCSGDWIFMGLTDSTASNPNAFITGAFGEKSVVFSTTKTTGNWGEFQLDGTPSGGVYWYKGAFPNSGYYAVGFSPQKSITVNSNYQVCISTTRPSCTDSLSWSTANQNTIMLDCNSKSENRYHKVVYTNTCPLIVTLT